MKKAYDHLATEDTIYISWRKSGKMRADENSAKKPFTIVLPPPNVTGELHLGHAAMLAIEDIMIRYKKMKGFEVLWIPGTDHAAIATENKVIEHLGLKSREEMSRESFLEECKKFAAEKRNHIVNQMKKMGAWLDWSREVYTKDEVRSDAANDMFKKLYDDGLIQRGYRMIHWSVGARSVLSDDEVEHKPVEGKFFHYKYFLAEKSNADDFIEIATTRPETLFGDTALAIHPDDPRAKDLVGKKVFVPFSDRKIPIIADTHADSEFGTGILKVTPSHDPNDFEIGKRHNLPHIQVIGFDGKMMDVPEVPEKFRGKTREECRKMITDPQDKEVQKYLLKHKPHTHNVGFCYRTDTVVEPMISPQWFLLVDKKIPTLKQSFKELLQEAVREKQVKIIPNRFEKNYFQWIDNLRDWCISRQIWWGHQIPVWYNADGTVAKVGSKNLVEKETEELKQDQDTLDTWFSSALWPMSPLGWPNEKSADFSKFYPTDVLETGWDILFFWVARMMMFGKYGTGEWPFHTIYLHGMVTDEKGQKMSKSKGNGIDPLKMIQEVGADAVRMSLVIGTSPGNNIPIGIEKIKGYRNFVNKLWNAGRFVKMKLEQVPKNSDAKLESLAKTMTEKWILSRFSKILAEILKHLDAYEISLAGNKIYHFVWDEFCAWYLETFKQEGSIEFLTKLFAEILKLVQPLCPFVTEALWQEVYKQQFLVEEAYPQIHFYEKNAVEKFNSIQNLAGKIRNLRAENGINPKDKITARISDNLDEETKALIGSFGGLIFEGDMDKNFAEISEKNIAIQISLPIDQKKKERQKAELQKKIENLKNRLANKLYVKNAPKELVEETKKELKEAEEKFESIRKHG